MPEPPDTGRLAVLLQLFADETRLRVAFMLEAERELCVGSICERLGMSQPAVSHHLALARVSGVFECRRQGKNNFYSLAPHIKPLLKALLKAAPAREPAGV